MPDFPALEDTAYERPTNEYDSDCTRRQHATSDAWRRSTRLSKSRQIRRALVHHRRLEDASKELSALASGQPLDQASELSKLAEVIAASTVGLNAFFSDVASTRFFNERRPATPSASRRVFDIPELLERILDLVNTRDLLLMQQVDKAMFHAIDGSKKLLRKLHLRSSLSGFLHTPFTPVPRTPYLKPPRFHQPLQFPGFVCYHGTYHYHTLADDNDLDLKKRGKVHVTAKFTEVSLPKIGDKCRNMLVCEPPIYEMRIYPLCCATNMHDSGLYHNSFTSRFPHRLGLRQPPVPAVAAADALRPGVQTVTSKNGLTVGDLYDATARTRESHRMCPFAPPCMHNDAGEIEMVVSFGGELQLSPKDPMYPTHPPVDPFRGLHEYDFDAETRRDEKVRRYTEAKQNALVDGRPIPTLTEFEEADRDS